MTTSACYDLQTEVLRHNDPYALLAWLVSWRDRPGPHQEFAAALLNYTHATLTSARRSLEAMEDDYRQISPAELIGDGE